MSSANRTPVKAVNKKITLHFPHQPQHKTEVQNKQTVWATHSSCFYKKNCKRSVWARFASHFHNSCYRSEYIKSPNCFRICNVMVFPNSPGDIRKHDGGLTAKIAICERKTFMTCFPFSLVNRFVQHGLYCTMKQLACCLQLPACNVSGGKILSKHSFY